MIEKTGLILFFVAMFGLNYWLHQPLVTSVIRPMLLDFLFMVLGIIMFMLGGKK